MLRLYNALLDRLNCTVASRRPEMTSILLERETAGFERKTETPAPDWAKVTVDVPAKIDQPLKELTVIEEISEGNSTVEDTREAQKYGERISDDALVTFCDRLKTALASKKRTRQFEGWLGINTILIFARMVAARRELEKAKQKNDKKAYGRRALESELGAEKEVQKEVEKAITGKNRVAQILFDASRLHYVVVYSSPTRDHLLLYDSLLDMDNPSRSLKNISDQIIALFGHLYEGDIPISIALDYEQQMDDWSCGYRAIACVLDIVFGRNVICHIYDLEKIHTLLIDALDSPAISYEEFHAATPFTESDGSERDDCERTYVRRDRRESGSREKDEVEKDDAT